MINLSQNGFTHNQVRNMLHMKHGSRKIRFRYFLLNQNENELTELKTIESGNVDMSAFSDIKRTARFRMKDTTYTVNGEEKEINWNSDRIQVFVEFKMPDSFVQETVNDEENYFITPVFSTDSTTRLTQTKIEGGWIAFSLGIFLFSSPIRVEVGGSIYRDVEAYDKLLIVKEDKITDRYTIKAGTTYYNAMVSLLNSAGVSKHNIENNGKTISNDKEYEPGTEKLRILNDLASDLNYTPFWVDEYGFFRSYQYRSPQEQPVDYEYADDDMSVTLNGMEEELDLFDLPNVFTVFVANPDTEEEYISTVENTNPNHPRSIENLGRRVVRFEEKDDIADQEALDSYVDRLASESSQVYGRLKFETAIMPFHSYSNVLRIRNSTLGINQRYSETNWSIPLQSGGNMTHEVRRVVSLS
ncbi:MULTISPECIES: hypothetical protein [Bacillaceae]|uniref:Uncharacterized protein n=1 Tax=Evansella alkalicola TaxID=745819 RepID=A0ABS6JZV1_9BACI|nr:MULTISPECIES: hypothetical protein [Bacillaceae]MBU9724119.1 hypothetical protein [Bacillus alkalicola]